MGTQACLESSAHGESGVRIETDALCQIMDTINKHIISDEDIDQIFKEVEQDMALDNLQCLLKALGLKFNTVWMER